MREPTLAWWPEHIPAGRATDAVTGEIDLLPTFVTLTSGTVPTNRPIDGADISKLLLGQSNVSAREAQYYYAAYQLQAIRSGPWKLALRSQNYSAGITTGGESKPGLRLYNLDTDISERTNVAAQHLEIVKKLKMLADHEAATLCDGSANGPGVRPPGRVDNPKPLYPMSLTNEKNRKHRDEEQ